MPAKELLPIWGPISSSVSLSDIFSIGGISFAVYCIAYFILADLFKNLTGSIEEFALVLIVLVVYGLLCVWQQLTQPGQHQGQVFLDDPNVPTHMLACQTAIKTVQSADTTMTIASVVEPCPTQLQHEKSQNQELQQPGTVDPLVCASQRQYNRALLLCFKSQCSKKITVLPTSAMGNSLALHPIVVRKNPVTKSRQNVSCMEKARTGEKRTGFGAHHGQEGGAKNCEEAAVIQLHLAADLLGLSTPTQILTLADKLVDPMLLTNMAHRPEPQFLHDKVPPPPLPCDEKVVPGVGTAIGDKEEGIIASYCSGPQLVHDKTPTAPLPCDDKLLPGAAAAIGEEDEDTMKNFRFGPQLLHDKTPTAPLPCDEKASFEMVTDAEKNKTCVACAPVLSKIVADVPHKKHWRLVNRKFPPLTQA